MAEGGHNPQLENEIAQIERQLAEKREALQRQQQTESTSGQLLHEKETLHEVVGEMIRPIEHTPQGLPPAAPPPAAGAPVPLGGQATPLPPQVQQQVQALVNMAFDTSIDSAIKAAKETNNPALIDAFHDILVDELYDHLVERGKLKRFDK